MATAVADLERMTTWAARRAGLARLARLGRAGLTRNRMVMRPVQMRMLAQVTATVTTTAELHIESRSGTGATCGRAQAGEAETAWGRGGVAAAACALEQEFGLARG